ncbi:MAG: Card1-like endonuclease domain-containing protein [Bernardetiaceae bacterium]
MARKVLVNLVSDQTVPSLQFIREFGESDSQHLFITTNQMEKRGCRKWIIDAAGLSDEQLLEPKIINPFSFDEIVKAFDESELSDDDEYLVNITGGTKLMSIDCFDFFKTLKSEIFYLTGQNDFIKLFPGRGEKKPQKLTTQVTLKEYLTCYGFDIQKESKPKVNKSIIDKFFLSYLKLDHEDHQTISHLRKHRSKKSLKLDEIEDLSKLLTKLNYENRSQDNLNKDEIKYLTGDWFEEYIFWKIKEELSLKEEYIGLGWELKKSEAPNEFDVLFVFDNRMYTVECKTSITGEAGKSLIGEILYKSDSLQKEFGLYANTSIIALDPPLKDKNGEFISKFKSHYNRAKLNRISIISRQDLLNPEISLVSLLGIKVTSSN